MLPSCGTKNAFMTLAEVSEKCSGTPAGTTSWLTLATPSLGIDEEPLPVERDDLDLERRLALRPSGLAGSSSCEPIQATPPSRMITIAGIAQTTSSMRAGELPVGQVARARVRGAEPPGEGEGRDDRRHDDRQHDGERVDQDGAVGVPDRPARIEDGPAGTRSARAAAARRRIAAPRLAGAARCLAAARNDDRKIQRAAWSDAASSACR